MWLLFISLLFEKVNIEIFGNSAAYLLASLQNTGPTMARKLVELYLQKTLLISKFLSAVSITIKSISGLLFSSAARRQEFKIPLPRLALGPESGSKISILLFAFF